MADFETAAAFVLEEEGGYEPPNQADPGGQTKFGISRRSYPNEDIKNLTVDRAKEIYRSDFWRFDSVTDQDVANKLLDLTVNLGIGKGVHLLQQALAYYFAGPIALDGVFGSHTLEFLNECPPAKLLRELRGRQAMRYCVDVMMKPAELPLALG